jgi:hypothetical protein
MAEVEFCQRGLLKWKQMAQHRTKVGWVMKGEKGKHYVYTNTGVKKL